MQTWSERKGKDNADRNVGISPDLLSEMALWTIQEKKGEKRVKCGSTQIQTQHDLKITILTCIHMHVSLK